MGVILFPGKHITVSLHEKEYQLALYRFHAKQDKVVPGHNGQQICNYTYSTLGTNLCSTAKALGVEG